MQPVCLSKLALKVGFIWITSGYVNCATTTTRGQSPAATCQLRTINYVTHSLPQLCFRSSWAVSVSSTFPSVSPTNHVNVENFRLPHVKTEPTHTVIGEAVHESLAFPAEELMLENTARLSRAVENGRMDWDVEELGGGVFLSFEEWKNQMAERSSQQNPVGSQRHLVSSQEGRQTEPEVSHDQAGPLNDASIAEIDIGVLGASRDTEVRGQPPADHRKLDEGGENDPKLANKDHYHSKDAGKTCKERFSYASFDAGATVLKTHPGAKNAKAVLVETRDSYMLSECATNNKFLIIELSEDIWIDTVVIANFEFFSSMIRSFRVSASDRYPVKMEKWKDLGTYMSRNTREIQAFLIENPQIWARYVRIEFLDHFGSEYYCPLSLVRVHGTRMLESWKETESDVDDDEAESFEHSVRKEPIVESAVITGQRDISREDVFEQLRSPMTDGSSGTSSSMDSSHRARNDYILEICHRSDAPASSPTVSTMPPISTRNVAADALNNDGRSLHQLSETERENKITSALLSTASRTSDSIDMEHAPRRDVQPVDHESTMPTKTKKATSSSGAFAAPSQASYMATASKLSNSTHVHKSRPSSTSTASSSLPTIQESFFKAVTRRLQLLETNSTLSLKYIEEQSRTLREAFSRIEKKQLQRTTAFLQTLNNTVILELHGFRQQYDEIWQSTIISLESQKAESRAEILAISARLSILADELVFQKRMSIVQSILLLLCLGLVIFSRVSAAGNLDIPATRICRDMFLHPLESCTESPLASPRTAPKPAVSEDGGQWLLRYRKRSGGLETSSSQSRGSSFSTLSSQKLRNVIAADHHSYGGELSGESSPVGTHGCFMDLEQSGSREAELNTSILLRRNSLEVLSEDYSEPAKPISRVKMSSDEGMPSELTVKNDSWGQAVIDSNTHRGHEALSHTDEFLNEVNKTGDSEPLTPFQTQVMPASFGIRRKPLPELPQLSDYRIDGH